MEHFREFLVDSSATCSRPDVGSGTLNVLQSKSTDPYRTKLTRLIIVTLFLINFTINRGAHVWAKAHRLSYSSTRSDDTYSTHHSYKNVIKFRILLSNFVRLVTGTNFLALDPPPTPTFHLPLQYSVTHFKLKNDEMKLLFKVRLFWYHCALTQKQNILHSVTDS